MSKKSFLMLIGSVCVLSTLLLMPFSGAYAKPDKPIELRYAYYGPSHDVQAKCINWWANELNKRTQGTVNIKVYWGGSLGRAMEIGEVVRKGIAEIGDSVWLAYFPKKYPLGDFPVPFLNKPLASWLAHEQLAKEYPEFDEELAANNMKRLTYHSVANIHLLSRRPIRKLKDIKGLKVRCSGKHHIAQIKAAGGVPVFIPSFEAYDALHKGVIDATTCTARWAVDYKWMETPAKYLTKIGMGGDAAQGAMINLDAWNSLPQNTKEVFLRLREEYPHLFEKKIYEEIGRAYKTLKDAGVEVIDFPEADRETWKSLFPHKKLTEEWIKLASNARGVSKSRVKEILDRYKELYKAFGTIYPRQF